MTVSQNSEKISLFTSTHFLRHRTSCWHLGTPEDNTMASKNPSKQRKRVTPVPLSALPENGNLTSPSRQPMIVSNNNNNNHNNDDDDGSSSSSDDEYHIQITKKFEAPKRAPVASPSSTLSRTTTLEQVRAAPMANAKTLSTRNNSSKTHVGQIKSIAGTSAVNSHGDHLLAGHREAISSAMANRPSILPEDSSNDKIDAEAEFSDDDDNNDDDEHDVPPTIEKLSKQCWKCAVRLKNTQFYAAHVHPLLRVPVCAVCVADVTYIDDDDKCLGCGEEEEFQFCCDNCPRSFCLICTAKAYGGGIPGLKQAQTLQNDDKPWHCPYCNPAPALKQLQQDFCPSDDEDDDENKNSRTAGERTCEEAVEEYLAIEHEKQRSLKEMDDPAFLEAKKAEIRDEIQKTKPLLSKKKLNLLVQEEMEELKERYEKHDIRLSDRAASLLEELETVHNIDLAKLHKKYFGDEQKPGEGEEEAQDDERAEWKLAADAEVAKRIEEDHRKPAKNALSEEMYLKDTPEEVEELGTQSADEKGCSGEGFRKVWGKPTKAAIESAIAEEDQLFARSNIAIQKRFTETADLKENRDEEYRTSGVGSGGSMRIRRDSYVELNQARGKVDKSAKKAKKKTKKRIELPPPQLQKLPVQEVVATMQQTSFQSEPKMEPGSDSTIAKKTALAASDLLDLTNVAPQKKKKRTKSKPVIAGTEPNNQLIIGLDEDRVSHGSSDKSDEVLDDKFYRTDDEDYANSDLILSSREIFHSDRNVKKIEVRTSLAKHLKPHQREGVTFLYKNAFVDLNVRTKKVEDLNEAKNVGGAVLAHSMGLGKSLSTIATLDTAMNHPCLKDKAENAFIHSVLLM